MKKVLKIINLTILFFILYLFTTFLNNSLMINTIPNKFVLTSNNKDSHISSEFYDFIKKEYNNINSNIALISNGYFLNFNNYKLYNKKMGINDIYISNLDYYVHDNKDTTLIDKNTNIKYNILGHTYDGTAFNINSLSKQQVLNQEFDIVYIKGKEEEVIKFVNVLNENNFNIGYKKVKEYEDLSFKGILSFIKYNIIIILLFLMSTYLYFLSNKKYTCNYNSLLFKHDYSIVDYFIIDIKNNIKYYFIALINLTILLLISSYLTHRYIFLGMPIFDLRIYMYLLIIIIIVLLLTTLIRTLTYRFRNNYA